MVIIKKYKEDLEHDCRSNFNEQSKPHVFRRWYISRITGRPRQNADKDYQSKSEPHVDLYVAASSDKFRDYVKKHKAKNWENFFSKLEEDDLQWWEDEDFDKEFHLPISKLHSFLDTHSSYDKSLPVYEGMVFIEVTDEHETRFYYFSLQARKTSKKVAQELLKGNTDAV